MKTVKLHTYCIHCDKEKLIAVDREGLISFSFNGYTNIIHVATLPIRGEFEVCSQTFQVKCPTCGSNRNFRATVED